MVVSTSVYVEHRDLALSKTIRACPEADVGVVSDAGTDPHNDVHIFWFEAPDFDAVETALADDHTVAGFTEVVESGDRRTYQIAYSDESKLFTPKINEVGGLVLVSESHARGWKLQLELPDHESLDRLDEYAAEEDIRLEVLNVSHTGQSEDRSEFGLTEAQIEALVCAYIHGYYDEPREISQEGLASILGISRTAVSGRLRRGSARLVEEILVDEPD